MSNSVVEVERRRLATAALLSKDLETITAWGLRNMVPKRPFGSNENQALPRSHLFKLLGVSITENMIWHEHVSSIATAAGKKLGHLFRARKYFSPSNLLMLYKAQIGPSLEFQRRAIRLIGDPALTCHLQPLSHRRAVGDFSLFYHYSNRFCSSELTSIIPPLQAS
nr:unnamed protein product [Callosobruchus chinensis]